MMRLICLGLVIGLVSATAYAEDLPAPQELPATAHSRANVTRHSVHVAPRQVHVGRHHVNYHDTRWNPHRPPTKREWQLRRYQQLYPKFYYGFHGRYLYTLGMPSGDVGIRGLPW